MAMKGQNYLKVTLSNSQASLKIKSKSTITQKESRKNGKT